jgi:hypothetical protein
MLIFELHVFCFYMFSYLILVLRIFVLASCCFSHLCFHIFSNLFTCCFTSLFHIYFHIFFIFFFSFVCFSHLCVCFAVHSAIDKPRHFNRALIAGYSIAFCFNLAFSTLGLGVFGIHVNAIIVNSLPISTAGEREREREEMYDFNCIFKPCFLYQQKQYKLCFLWIYSSHS